MVGSVGRVVFAEAVSHSLYREEEKGEEEEEEEEKKKEEERKSANWRAGLQTRQGGGGRQDASIPVGTDERDLVVASQFHFP